MFNGLSLVKRPPLCDEGGLGNRCMILSLKGSAGHHSLEARSSYAKLPKDLVTYPNRQMDLRMHLFR